MDSSFSACMGEYARPAVVKHISAAISVPSIGGLLDRVVHVPLLLRARARMGGAGDGLRMDAQHQQVCFRVGLDKAIHIGRGIQLPGQDLRNKPCEDA